MQHIAAAQETVCTVCASFPCECPSTEQYDESAVDSQDLSDMEIPARVVGNDQSWLERFAS